MKTVLEIIEEILEPIDGDCELSKYTYIPGAEGPRENTRIPIPQLQEKFNTLNSALAPAEEIAISSRVYTAGNILHIPMIDFSVGEITDDSEIKQLLKEFNISQAFLASSGRSYHLYGNNMLTPREWTRFMGSALLLNKVETAPVTDSRWVGYRLRQGYGALRLTNNSNNYKQEPTFERIIEP